MYLFPPRLPVKLLKTSDNYIQIKIEVSGIETNDTAIPSQPIMITYSAQEPRGIYNMI